MQKPYSGIFVVNQFELLKEDKQFSRLDLYTMARTFTGPFGSILKYVKAFIRFGPSLFVKYDLLHVHFFFPFILLAIAYKIFHPKTKIVVTIHGTDVSRHINSRFNRLVYSKAASYVDYFIAVGTDIAIEAESKLNRKMNIILSAGVDSRTFYKLPQSIKNYDFVFAGSFVERKGIDLLMEAIEKMPIAGLRYCFIGSGSYLSKLQELVKKIDGTIFENLTQEKMKDVFNASRFIILPSRQEPFGLVITEALFCGTPAIVAPSGGLREQVKNGFNGFILNKNTVDDLVTIMVQAHQMNDEEYSQMAANALVSNKKHSLQEICKKHVEIYQQLITRSHE